MSLISLPVEILEGILLRLDHQEIFRLREVCSKLKMACTSPGIWRKVQFSSPIILKMLWSCLPLMKNVTKELFIKGFARGRGKLKENLSRKYLARLELFCPDLKLLHLEQCFINGLKISFEDLPKSLEKLCLADCEVKRADRFMNGQDKFDQKFPVLREFRMSSCSWFHFRAWPMNSTVVKEVVLRYADDYYINDIFVAASRPQSSVEVLDLTDLLPTVGISCRRISKPLARIKKLCLRSSSSPFPGINQSDIEQIWDCVRFPNLEELDLSGCRINNSLLTKLSRSFPCLRILRVERTQITEDGVAELTQALPRCLVYR